jgi:hypothetical protein
MAGFLERLSLPSLLLLVPIAILTSLMYYILFSPRVEFPLKAPKQASAQYPVVGALGYFSEKWDFYRRSSRESPSGSFSFHLGKHAVVGLAGEVGRQAFYESRELGITQGRVCVSALIARFELMWLRQSLNPRIPGPPELPDVFGKKISLEDKEFHPYFIRRVHSILTTERFSRGTKLPLLYVSR